MKALVVDDEELARRRVLNLLAEVEEIEVLGECSNGKSAISQINKLKPGLVFLDINMKDMNGFEVLQKLKLNPKPVVVFVTAYDNYATKAFEVDAFDFLLKPFRDERFFRTIKKVLNISNHEVQEHFEKRLQTLFEVYSNERKSCKIPLKLPVRQGNKTVLLIPKEITYICASGYYAEIYTENNKYLLRESLNNLEDFFKEHAFFRIHRSAIINLNHIKEIVHSDFSEVDVKMTDHKILRISKSNKKALFDKLGI